MLGPSHWDWKLLCIFYHAVPLASAALLLDSGTRVRCWSDPRMWDQEQLLLVGGWEEHAHRCCTAHLKSSTHRACFDTVLTYRECCPGYSYGKDLRGSAVLQTATMLLSPDASPENDYVGGTHPSLSRDQHRFERLHANASNTTVVRWKQTSKEAGLVEVTMTLHFFKRSGLMLETLYHDFLAYLATLEEQGHTLAAGDWVVDIGASVGYFAIALALHFPKVRVLAVEPAPQNYRYMLWNILENGVEDRVWPLNMALAYPGGRASWPLRYSPIWPIASSDCPQEDRRCEFVDYWAQSISFAELIDLLQFNGHYGHIRWLKMDCEGCEWQAIGIPSVLLQVSETVQLLTAELHPLHVPPGEAENARQLIRMLCPEGPTRTELLRKLDMLGAESDREKLISRQRIRFGGQLCTMRLGD
eukprot:gnl/TRDRNA2_/TRDRNA2_75461_c0_seq1.p1 gnl/TRDRNA2_/TRDRNA2_75461_c0~~gnl/TRDRNA2_/TRDRNA2_75461_c0_seq1.p1  ORF type:complete len:416 (+),score=36.22 gnl/TRDRNA2_/TRDRNA2_75461_c0_seq1:2-1249(+)